VARRTGYRSVGGWWGAGLRCGREGVCNSCETFRRRRVAGLGVGPPCTAIAAVAGRDRLWAPVRAMLVSSLRPERGEVHKAEPQVSLPGCPSWQRPRDGLVVGRGKSWLLSSRYPEGVRLHLRGVTVSAWGDSVAAGNVRAFAIGATLHTIAELCARRSRAGRSRRRPPSRLSGSAQRWPSAGALIARAALGAWASSASSGG